MATSFFPNSFSSFLKDNNPIFKGLSTHDQTALASILYSALINQSPHKYGCNTGVFTIYWKDKQHLFGSADAFNELNIKLQWFELLFPARVGSATGYVLTDDAQTLGETYLLQSLEQSLQSPIASLTAADKGFTCSTGEVFRRATRAVRSKMKATEQKVCNSTRFPNTSLRPSVPINADSVRQFYETALRRMEDKGTDAKRKQREAIQALAMLDISKRYGAPGGHAMPSTYVESSKGRLYAEGSLNLQNCIRGLRKAALKGCYDIDVISCHWTILYQLAKRQEVESPAIRNYLEHTKSTRNQVANDLDISIADAKFIFIAQIYGAPLRKSHRYHPSSIQERIGLPAMTKAIVHPIILGLNNELQKARKAILEFARKDSSKPGFIINAAGHQLQVKSQSKAEPITFKRPKTSQQMAHLLQGQESEILRVCLEVCTDVLIVQHDGFCSRQKIDITALSAVVQEKTGIAVTFSQELL